jgi:VWFA-related protein
MTMIATGRCWIFLASLVLFGAPSLSGQSTNINLDVVVTAKSGPPVTGLDQSDFTLLDNKTPQHLTSFRAIGATQEPVHVIVVIDAVNASYESIAYQRGQIDKFLQANGGQLFQPTALAFFSDLKTEIQEDFSTNGNELSSSLENYAVSLRSIRRSSQWEANDRFRLSVNALRSITERVAGLPGRKLIFWISPGWPLLSGPRIELTAKQQDELFASIVGLSNQLRESRITLYNVNPIGPAEGVGRQFYYLDFVKGVSKPGKAQVADLSLQVLATQTGGLVLSGSNDVDTMLKQCMDDSLAYYTLSFTAAKPDKRDEYHHIEVRLDKPGLTARTRDGYYAQP